MSGRISNRSVVGGVRDAAAGGSSDDKDNPNEFDALYADSQEHKKKERKEQSGGAPATTLGLPVMNSFF
ncbi:hypothetical protein B9Z55_014089 [Caenorhabditis nigoni]|uniref:Uncharacterized protein n=1 Tax=Caenorhabditis nigoni TaxID=1611254 RepID=A0A2G5U4I0_9PELO|nr:hypothetical protein B9Z55_014089 [Caenorhabditis nigoni]